MLLIAKNYLFFMLSRMFKVAGNQETYGWVVRLQEI
ncbi:hypothetical protein PF66_05170 [Pseudomonas asplenii]|uniref:Uncharacterized protein n=1 Tax=Pseudomonas asplenii TaxID=53407 RepID=A0A0N0E1Z0_9PSED|nr:hypothetical protein PF66_05170 [Pseudomonas fuscovaginae]